MIYIQICAIGAQAFILTGKRIRKTMMPQTICCQWWTLIEMSKMVVVVPIISFPVIRSLGYHDCHIAINQERKYKKWGNETKPLRNSPMIFQCFGAVKNDMEWGQKGGKEIILYHTG